MKIIAFIQEREEVIRILKHLEMWPIEYPKTCPVEARALPFNFKLLRTELGSGLELAGRSLTFLMSEPGKLLLYSC